MRYSIIFVVLMFMSATAISQENDSARTENDNPLYMDIDLEAYEDSQVVFKTTFGEIAFNLYPDVAPHHVASFVTLINTGFYDSLTFHRVVKDVLIQGGSPNGRPDGKGSWNLPAEFSTIEHVDGSLAMARTRDINGASCQFYITLRRVPMYDGKYTIFGKIADSTSLAVAHEIGNVETTGKQDYPRLSDTPIKKVYIEKAYIRAKPEVEKTGKGG